MTDTDALERRLAAVERAVVDGDREPADLPEAAAVADDIDDLRERVDEIEARLAELEGATQALRGYVGNVRSVNEAVTDRADAAVATVDRLEYRLNELEERLDADARDEREDEPPDGDPSTDRIDGGGSDGEDGSRFSEPDAIERRSGPRDTRSEAPAGNASGARAARSTDGGLALRFDDLEEEATPATDQSGDADADEDGVFGSIRDLFR